MGEWGGEGWGGLGREVVLERIGCRWHGKSNVVVWGCLLGSFGWIVLCCFVLYEGEREGGRGGGEGRNILLKKGLVC